MNTSFRRFSWLAVLLAVALMTIWMGFVWGLSSNSQRPSSSSDGRFSHQVSRECILSCSTPTPNGKPEIHTDALECINRCMVSLHLNKSELQSKAKTTLRQIILNAAKFQVECDLRGGEKSFRFTEVFKNQEPTYLVIVVDTTNCSVMRLENLCDFMDKTGLLNKTES
ncbi:MAG: hypothetical protein ACJATE_000958 [Bacteroidia bacterium]|jgi:hypothetical protein